MESWCRSCFAENNARYYAENREAQKARLIAGNAHRRDRNRRKAAEYLSTHPCVDCGESDIVVLDFDHVGKKVSAISAMIAAGARWERIEAEIGNCQVRCANCHRIRTAAAWFDPERHDQREDPRPCISAGAPAQLRPSAGDAQRTCRICGMVKSAAEFPLRSAERQTRQWICLACQRIYTKTWYERNRARHVAAARRNNSRRRARAAAQVHDARRLLRCVDCGEANPLLLDFDHVSSKVADISTMVRNGSPWTVIAAEIAKCQPRCANCHRRKTAREQNWWKVVAS